MKPLNLLVGLGVLAGWVMMNIAFITYALFWRMDNEPGYTGPVWMLALALAMAGLGILLFIVGHIFLLAKRARNEFILTWLAVLVVGICFCGLSPFWLILMV